MSRLIRVVLSKKQAYNDVKTRGIMNVKRLITTLLFSVAVIATMFAQSKTPTYRVQGEAIDSLTRKGEPYATISIYKDGAEEKPVAMAVTDVNGKFNVEAKGEGKYVFVLSSMGRNAVRRTFQVELGKKTVNLGALLLTDSRTELKGVEVVAYKPLVKSDVDKLTYSVEDDPESKVNTVMDMLKKVPMVTVDGQDNIKVNGSSSFKIYVNGKPNNMMSNNPKEVLKSMPAVSIKKIEVITNPGPKYEAEGVGGILNIITEGKGPEGYTATVSLRLGNYGIGSGVFATVKKGKFTVSANYNNSFQDDRKSYSNSDRTTLDDSGNVTTETVESRQADPKSQWHGGSIEASYEIDTLRLITASVSLNRFSQKQNGTLQSNTFIPSVMANLYGYSSGVFSNNTYNDISGGLDYQRSFSVKDRLLTFSYRIESSPATTEYSVKYNEMQAGESWTDFLNRLKNQDTNGEQSSTEQTFQIDYTTPFAKHHTFETGAKYILRSNKSTNDKYDSATNGDAELVYDAENSSHFKHRNDIFAAYLGYGMSLKKWSSRLGLRYEHTLQDVKYLLGRGNNFRKNFDDLVPSVKLGYKFTDMMNLSLSYKMRISRPGIWYLNPYLDDSSPESISQGNSNLDSEKTHSFDVQFGSFGQKLSYSLSASYAFTNNSIQEYRKMLLDTDISGLQNPTGKQVMYTTYYNMGRTQNANFSGYVNWNPLQNTRLTMNIWGGYTHITDGQKQKNHGWNMSVWASVQQTIAKTWNLSVSAYKQTPGVMLQGKTGSYYSYDFSASKSFMDKKLSITFACVNPFNKYFKYKSNMAGTNFAYNVQYKFCTQYFVLGVSYRIGKLNAGVKKAQRSIANDDVKQGGGKSGGKNSGQGAM